MLFVPPCINKYYILDLQPENSLIRYTVEQGHRIFVVSWRNPDESAGRTRPGTTTSSTAPITRHPTWCRQISGAETINTLGFCVGGTILATALAVLAARGEQPAHSLTLLTTLLDFSDTGILDIFIDEAMVQMREMTLGAQAPGGPGLLKGKELATTFSFLRPNDLVWNYVVGNYLKGETPPPFDLLYWNGDSHQPARARCTAGTCATPTCRTNCSKPGKLTVCGEKVDLRPDRGAGLHLRLARGPHRALDGAYASMPLVKGSGTRQPGRFVLGASGHIAGVINPPAKGKRSHWTNDKLPASAQEWFDGATEHPGSWWPRLVGLAQAPGRQAGRRTRRPGNAKLQADRAGPRPLRQGQGLSLARLRAGPRPVV